jgi:hypothetical protein
MSEKSMPLYEGQQKICNFTIRMPLSLKNIVKEIATEEEITPTFFIRNSIERAVQEWEKIKMDQTSST